MFFHEIEKQALEFHRTTSKLILRINAMVIIYCVHLLREVHKKILFLYGKKTPQLFPAEGALLNFVLLGDVV